MRKPRAAAVVISGTGDQVLLMRRHRDGVDYHVLPGGGIERGESGEAACIRELHEEMSLSARIDRLLWTIEHPDRRATYFLMRDVRGEVRLSGPEAARNNPQNSYAPAWVRIEDLHKVNLQPAGLVDLLRSLSRP